MTQESRHKKSRKDSCKIIQREERRKNRLKRLNTGPCHGAVEYKQAQNRIIIDLAWKTVALIRRNSLIQQKIIALQKETSEFVSAVLGNPDNRKLPGICSHLPASATKERIFHEAFGNKA